MSPLDQRIAIAESVGWTKVLPYSVDNGRPWGFSPGPDPDFDTVPDYLNDLNAMHEVINNLPNEVMNNYLDNLCILTNGECANMDGSYRELRNMQRATAAQRAEAYLRTINKWKD